MSTSLFTIVEVHPSQRIRCQAPGCHKSVYKRIHVIRDGDQVVAVGSDCWARLYAHTTLGASTLRVGSSEGRLLTPEEREMLASNTKAFVARMEQEAAAADDQRAARCREQQRLSDLHAPLVVPETARRAQPAATARNALATFRAQQAAQAARKAVASLPPLGAFPLQMVAQAMVDAKADCLARGIKLSEPGSRQLIETRALELLQRLK